MAVLGSKFDAGDVSLDDLHVAFDRKDQSDINADASTN